MESVYILRLSVNMRGQRSSARNFILVFLYGLYLDNSIDEKTKQAT